VRPSRFEAGQWVWYYNPRKYPGRQMKWTQQYEGPYLVLKMLSPLVAKIQQSSRNKPKIVHIDKLKQYEGVAPRMWPTAIVTVDAQRDGGQNGVTDPYIPSSSENQGETYPVTSSASGQPICAQGNNGETNVATTVGQWPSNSYENSGKSNSETSCGNDCCATHSRSIPCDIWRVPLGPAVSVNVEREM